MGFGTGMQGPTQVDQSNTVGKGQSQPIYPQATQGGQPQFGQPNKYANTMGPWDNATIAPQSSQGKGGKAQSNYPTMPTSYGQSSGKNGATQSQPTTQASIPAANPVDQSQNQDYSGYSGA